LLVVVVATAAEEAGPEAALLFGFLRLCLGRLFGVGRCFGGGGGRRGGGAAGSCRDGGRQTDLLRRNRTGVVAATEHAGEAVEERALRVQRADLRRLRAADEEVGVDHRPPLRVAVGRDDLDI